MDKSFIIVRTSALMLFLSTHFYRTEPPLADVVYYSRFMERRRVKFIDWITRKRACERHLEASCRPLQYAAYCKLINFLKCFLLSILIISKNVGFFFINYDLITRLLFYVKLIFFIFTN